MAVEFELKYRATQAVQEAVLRAYPGAWQRISMRTAYYDTPDAALSSRRCTLRRRLENGRAVCTLKTPAGDLGRGEWEVEAADIHSAVPTLCVLSGVALPREGLTEVCGAEFTRMALTLPLDGGAVELALDAGALFAGAARQSLCEIEVELKAGAPAVAVAFAQALADKYGLQPEKKSKFRRALELREKE